MDYYQQNYSVIASDMDVTYHMTPNAIMLYFQDCFARFLTSKRLAAFDIIKDDLIWIISDLEVNFVKERPLWSSSITVKIRFREIAAIRIYVDYQLCDSRGDVFAGGTSTWAVINSRTRRPFPAEEMLEKGGITAAGKAERPDMSRENTGRTLIKNVQHVVNVTDLDFNGHVCNRTYLLISLATQPLEFIKQYSPQYMHIKFNREAFFGETLDVRVFGDGGQKYWYDIENSHGKNICSIYSEWKNNTGEFSKDVSEMIER